ncbi:MerR family DNA-binding protein [Microbulbifer taiwanensis]
MRYYERRGLIAQPRKPDRGHRAYPRETLERLLFIKRAEKLGFTLEEIANLLALGETPCNQVREMAEYKLAGVRDSISDLKRLESVLTDLLARCRNNPDPGHCPNVESLYPSDK